MGYELENAGAGDGARDHRRHRGGRSGRPVLDVAALGDIVERAAVAGSVITESWARAAWGWLLLRVDPAAALPVIEVGLAEARRIDYPIAVAVDLRSLAFARLLLGDLPGAVDAAGELLDDLLERGALSNARLLVDVTAVLAHRGGHPDWASLATTAQPCRSPPSPLPITNWSRCRRSTRRWSNATR